jgi:hypothetical protein
MYVPHDNRRNQELQEKEFSQSQKGPLTGLAIK